MAANSALSIPPSHFGHAVENHNSEQHCHQFLLHPPDPPGKAVMEMGVGREELGKEGGSIVDYHFVELGCHLKQETTMAI